jgi:hypothetical protein
MKIFIIVIICLYVAFDVVTAKMMSAKEMKEHFIDNQCIVGKIAANIFYAPAWFLKGLKFIINIAVK